MIHWLERDFSVDRKNLHYAIFVEDIINCGKDEPYHEGMVIVRECNEKSDTRMTMTKQRRRNNIGHDSKLSANTDTKSIDINILLFFILDFAA